MTHTENTCLIPLSLHLNYFKRSAATRPTAALVSTEQLPTSAATGLNQPTVDAINSALLTMPRKNRTQYTPSQRALIGKFSSQHGATKAVKKFGKDFPKLCNKTVLRMERAYNEEAGNQGGDVTEVCDKKRGRPSSLPEALQADLKCWMLLKLREAGGVVNKHVVSAALFGIVESNPRYAGYVHFTPTRGWLNHLYSMLNLARRRATIARPPISLTAYNETVVRVIPT